MEELNYLKIKKELPINVNLLAVSKGFNSNNINKLFKLGQYDFGESKFQEAFDKRVSLKSIKSLKWHFIGRIQNNKIRKIVQNFDYIHSVDSYKKLLKISNIAEELGKVQKVMIQVKFAEDPGKGGIIIDQLMQEWNDIKVLKNIRINGLMTINPKGLSSKDNLELFKDCRSLADSLDLKDCSMGMSEDWREAVEAGSTWIRIGSLIFGDRKSMSN